MNLIVIFMTCTCIVMHSLFCQLPNCNLFTQHVISLWRDTSSELWTPVHSFTLILQSSANTVYFSEALFYFTANKHLFPHYTSNPLFSANQWDWQPHCKLGQSSLGCYVQVPHFCWRRGSLVNHAPDYFLAPCQSQLATTVRSDFFLLLVDCTLVSYWAKTCCCAHHTLLLGFPNGSFETSQPHPVVARVPLAAPPFGVGPLGALWHRPSVYKFPPMRKP
jgi:hypothetical protein